MVTPALVLAFSLLAQDAPAPPARIQSATTPGATSNLRRRRPQPAVAAAPVDITAGESPHADESVPPESDAVATPQSGVETNEATPLEEPSQPTTPDDSASPRTLSDLPSGTRVVPAPPDHPPGSPAAVLADAIALRAELSVTGSPMRLLDVIARARNPRTRLATIDAYWSVALSWISAHWQWSDHDFLTRLDAMSPALADETQRQARDAQLGARLAAASADWRQAELDVTEAQQRLAVYLRLGPNEALPLAADLPHVGAYKTRFETLYASQLAPERALVIHHTLPLRERELRLRAQAILAAHDALDAAEAGYQQGTVSLESVLSCLDDQARERNAFLAVVRKYSLDIAEYALTTPLPAGDDRVLAARLIKLRREDGWRWEPRNPTQPSASAAEVAAPIAVVPPASSAAGQVQFQQPSGRPAAARQLDIDHRAEPSRGRTPARSPTSPGNDINPPPQDGAQANPLQLRVVAGWSELDVAQQVTRLNELLHDVSPDPVPNSLPSSFAACLARVAPPARRELIVVYWRARESVAQRQVFASGASELESLRPLLVGQHSDPHGNLAMLRWRTAQLDNGASIAAVDAVLLEQRVRLTAIAGHAITSAWLWPSTAPLAGEQRAPATQSPTSIRTAKAYAVLRDRAALVVANTAAYERAIRSAAQDPAAAMDAVESINTETMAAVDFLASVTRYNLAAADLVLTALPAGSSAERISQALGFAEAPPS